MIEKKKKFKLGDFDYALPKKYIAQYPGEKRDQAKLMVVNRETKSIEHKKFSNIVDHLRKNDLLILNNTKVFPARLHANKEKTGAMIEVFLLRELDKENRIWDVLVDPARKIRIGNKLFFGDKDDLIAEVIDNTTSRGRTLRFLFDGTHEEFKEVITSLGETPIPKHLDRVATAQDTERYQTVYAEKRGAVAAEQASAIAHCRVGKHCDGQPAPSCASCPRRPR